ncbi:MAG: penicillin-binding protein 1A [Hyphomonas sp.]|uniref:transglycosylase domain-containing protein n=1 Tax=Hyphomonas sp. TaxID=87 RepID=UPI0025BDD189|nr:PBP1A family penicillin-binding protein [Hyphomonas sp.]MBA4338157.1 penicillin-binding protein 1A [Hyphomonas sp.]
MSNQFPTPPQMPRIVRLPAPAFLRRQSAPVRFLLMAVAALLLMGGLWAAWKWHSLHNGMPKLPSDISELWHANREPAIEFVDANGKTLAVNGPRYGRAIDVKDLPRHVPQAFLAAEDKRFYQHDGADETAIARAAFSNAAAGETVSGASTITQQLVKNLVLHSGQTMQRKAQEITLARQLEKRLTKDEILSLYLNRVYFGAGLYGIDAASRFYFGKPPEQMTIPEAALLAALPKAPSKLNLRDNLAGAKERQVYVLREMRAERFISREEEKAALEAEITIIKPPVYDPELGYVLDVATERLSAVLPRVPGDAVVTLTIDPELQARVQARVNERLAKEGPALKATQAAALILGTDGRVVAMVGGTDYKASPFNRVTQAKRQPGSSFKPFVYALALEDGYSPYDVFNDRPISIGKWKPVNYNGEYIGPMTLSEALTRSTNTIAAELGNESNPERVAELAKRFGIKSTMQPYPSLALGSQEVSLWEITGAYGVFQSGGRRMEPYIIAKVADTRGNVLFEQPAAEAERVYAEDYTADMNAMLTRVVSASIGTGHNARLKDWTVAGKTGTSQDWRDAWFVGFTSAYVGGVWVGNDDDTAMKKVTGGGLPADIWSDLMEMAHEGKRPAPLFGSDTALVLDPASEDRIAFYRGMAQAFASAAPARAASGGGEMVQQAE